MDHFLNSLFLKSTKDAPPNYANLKNILPSQIKLRELGDLRKIPGPTKQLQFAAEDSLIDVNRDYHESVCNIPNTARSTFLMVFSSDSKLVASTHGDHNIYITELSSGKLISTLRGHPRTPWCIAFHPTSSEVLASGCLGGQVRVWDLHGGSELWIAQSQTVIASLAFHPVHRILAIASYNEIYFWDWSTEKAFAKSITGNDKEKVRYVAFDEGGSKLITGIANMSGKRASEWDRVWPGSGFVRAVSMGSITPSNISTTNSIPPPPPPPPPSSDTRITTFCYRYMLARYEQLMRRYRELSGRNPNLPLSESGSNVGVGLRRGRREVSAGTDEITASLSSTLRQSSPGQNRRRRSVGSSATTSMDPPPLYAASLTTTTETPSPFQSLTGRRRRSVGSNAAPDGGTDQLSTSTIEVHVERSPSQSPAARRRRSVGSTAATDRPGTSTVDDNERPPLASRRTSLFGDHPRDSSSSAQPFSNNCRELLERVGELRCYIHTAWMHAMRARQSGDTDSSSSSAIAHLASLMAGIPGGSNRPRPTVDTWQDGAEADIAESPTDEGEQPEVLTPTGRLTEVLASALRRLRQINRQLRELEGGRGGEDGDGSGGSLSRVTSEYNSLRTMEQLLLRRIEEQEQQMESEVSRVRRFSSTLLTFDHDYASTPTGRLLAASLDETLQEDSDSPESSSAPSPPLQSAVNDLESSYARNLAANLVRERVERQLFERRLSSLLGSYRASSGSPSQLSMSSSPTIACQATAATSSSQSNSSNQGTSRQPPDLASVRLGMQLLSRHIDNMSRLCRVRFEMVQLRQVREMWDELQRSWVELQDAVEGTSDDSNVFYFPEPSTSRDPCTPSTSREHSLLSTSREFSLLSPCVLSTSRDPSFPSTSQDASSASLKDPCQPSTSKDPCLPSTSQDAGSPSTSLCQPSTSQESSTPSTSRAVDTSSETDSNSPNQQTPSTTARREVSSVTPVTSSSGVDSEGDGSSGSYSRPPLLSFRRSARTSASKRARFESAFRYFTRYSGGRGRSRSSRLYSEIAMRPSGAVPATDEASDEEESTSQATPLPSHHQVAAIISQSRRKRTLPSSLTPHEGVRGGRLYSGGRVLRGSSNSNSGGPGRFQRHRLSCCRPPASTSTQTSTSRQNSYYRSSNLRDFSSQTPPFLIDASVGTDPEMDESTEFGSAAGRLRARQALHQMIESLLDFLENDTFTRNLPADTLQRRIVCLYNLLQRALELTTTLIVQIMPLPTRTSLSTAGEASSFRSHVLSPFDHRRPPLRRSSTLSTTTSPPSSSSSGSESVRTIPSLQVNDAPMDEADLESSSVLWRRVSASSRPPAMASRPPRWADLPPTPPYPPPPRIFHFSPVDDSTDDSSSSHVYIDPSFYIRCHNIGLTHRIQAWDFTDCQIPEISNAQKNVVVAECRVHNDASVDISKDGKLLVALLPSVSMGPITNTNMLGIYSLEWATLGQCLYRTVCLQNAVSVSLSPTSRHLIVGLTSKRSLMSLNIPQYLAQVCRLNGGEARIGGEKAGNLVLMRGIKLPTNSDTISVNCIRWVPCPGAGFVYGTNTGQLKVLR